MILKKPYAFLIKYYRIIHMLLFALLSVFVYKYYDIIKFFNNYVRSGYKTTVVTDLEKIYTPFSLFLCVFAIIFLSIIIVVLLNHKKKPYGLYASLIIYYVIALIALFYLASVFKGFEMELLASTVSRGIRDIIIIYFLPQFVFLCLILVRVVGFNIRKFDFTDARNEFVGDANDAEEVEINFKIDGHKLKQTFNRATREGVYYLKENKFIVVCILIALGITSVFLIYKNTHNNYDRYYSMARVFVYKDLNISVEDAIVTNLDFNGNVIKENKYYVVLKMHVANDTGDNKTLDYNHFKLIIDGKNINPIVSYAKYFADFASGEVISSYSPKAERTFALVYEIDAKQARKNAKLNIFTGSVYEKGEYLSKKIFVNIKPKRMDNLEIVSNYIAREVINFEGSLIGDTTLTVNNYLIDKSYTYSYTSCINANECKEFSDIITVPLKDNRYDNKLIIISVDYHQDMTIDYSDNNTSLKSFAEHFVKIQYRVGNEVYSDNSINVTPLDSDKFLAFELPSNISDANIIQAIITVRDKQYIINLKM